MVHPNLQWNVLGLLFQLAGANGVSIEGLNLQRDGTFHTGDLKFSGEVLVYEIIHGPRVHKGLNVVLMVAPMGGCG